MGNLCCCIKPEEVKQPVLKKEEQYPIDNDFPFIVIGNVPDFAVRRS